MKKNYRNHTINWENQPSIKLFVWQKNEILSQNFRKFLRVPFFRDKKNGKDNIKSIFIFSNLLTCTNHALFTCIHTIFLRICLSKIHAIFQTVRKFSRFWKIYGSYHWKNVYFGFSAWRNVHSYLHGKKQARFCWISRLDLVLRLKKKR